MKPLFLAAALGLGSLGLLGAAPSRADASWLSEALHARFDPYYYGGYYPPAYAYPDYGYYGYGYYAPGYVYPDYGYYAPYYGPGVSFYSWPGYRYGHWHGHHGGWHGGWHGGHGHHHGGWHGGHGHHHG